MEKLFYPMTYHHAFISVTININYDGSNVKCQKEILDGSATGSRPKESRKSLFYIFAFFLQFVDKDRYIEIVISF